MLRAGVCEGEMKCVWACTSDERFINPHGLLLAFDTAVGCVLLLYKVLPFARGPFASRHLLCENHPLSLW